MWLTHQQNGPVWVIHSAPPTPSGTCPRTVVCGTYCTCHWGVTQMRWCVWWRGSFLQSRIASQRRWSPTRTRGYTHYPPPLPQCQVAGWQRLA